MPVAPQQEVAEQLQVALSASRAKSNEQNPAAGFQAGSGTGSKAGGSEAGVSKAGVRKAVGSEAGSEARTPNVGRVQGTPMALILPGSGPHAIDYTPCGEWLGADISRPSMQAVLHGADNLHLVHWNAPQTFPLTPPPQKKHFQADGSWSSAA